MARDVTRCPWRPIEECRQDMPLGRIPVYAERLRETGFESECVRSNPLASASHSGLSPGWSQNTQKRREHATSLGRDRSPDYRIP
jgi:hypothetical protein